MSEDAIVDFLRVTDAHCSVQFRTLSFAVDLATLQETARLYAIMLAELQAKASGQWRVSCLHQIWSPLYTANSTARGGNVLGMERYRENFIMYQSYLSWSEAEDDELFIDLGKILTNGIQKFAQEKGTAVDYLYLFGLRPDMGDCELSFQSLSGTDHHTYMWKEFFVTGQERHGMPSR